MLIDTDGSLAESLFALRCSLFAGRGKRSAVSAFAKLRLTRRSLGVGGRGSRLDKQQKRVAPTKQRDPTNSELRTANGENELLFRRRRFHGVKPLDHFGGKIQAWVGGDDTRVANAEDHQQALVDAQLL